MYFDKIQNRFYTKYTVIIWCFPVTQYVTQWDNLSTQYLKYVPNTHDKWSPDTLNINKTHHVSPLLILSDTVNILNITKTHHVSHWHRVCHREASTLLKVFGLHIIFSQEHALKCLCFTVTHWWYSDLSWWTSHI